MSQDTNLMIQYTIVGAILLAASIWVIVRLVKTRRRIKNGEAQGGCSCCELADTCKKSKLKSPDSPSEPSSQSPS